MKRWGCITTAILLMALWAQATPNPFALASLLIRDGHFSRAEKIVNQTGLNGFGKPHQYHTLKALIALHQRRYKESEQHFLKSQSLGQKPAEVSIYLAEIYLKTERYQKAQNELEKVGSSWKQKLPYFLLAADINWQLGLRQKSWSQLIRAGTINSQWQNLLAKKKFAFLMKDRVYYGAFQLAWKTLQEQNTRPQDLVAMATALSREHQWDLGIKLLEGARLRFANESLITLPLADLYLKQKQNQSATLLLEELSRTDKTLAFEASELLRQTDQSYRSPLRLLDIKDPKKKMKQQMALLLENEDFHSLNQLYPQMGELQLMDDENLRYAMAYSFFKGGHFVKSEKLLSKIGSETLFEKATELRKEIAKCSETPWSCHETI